MPSTNTRVSLTLSADLVAILDRMGKVTGAGRATIVREWLIEATPMLAEMARAMELASQKNVDAFKVMSETLHKVANDTDQLSLDMKSRRRAAMRKKVR